MKFRELFEAKSAKDIIINLYNKNDWYSDIIDKELDKINPREEFDYSEKDFQKVKKIIEDRLKNDIKISIYNYIYDGIPDGLDIKLTKKEFTNSLKTMSGKRIPVDKNGMPYEDVKDYDIIMDFYRKYVQ